MPRTALRSALRLLALAGAVASLLLLFAATGRRTNDSLFETLGYGTAEPFGVLGAVALFALSLGLADVVRRTEPDGGE